MFVFFLGFFVHTIDYTQYNTQIVQIQTQRAPALDWRDNKLIFCLLPHSHDIILYVFKTTDVTGWYSCFWFFYGVNGSDTA